MVVGLIRRQRVTCPGNETNITRQGTFARWTERVLWPIGRCNAAVDMITWRLDDRISPQARPQVSTFMRNTNSLQQARALRGRAGFRAVNSRRQAIQAGVFGALGLSLGDLLRLEACGQESGTQALSATKGMQTKPTAKALSVIQLHLGGGMSQQESFDPKPEAPVEYRGSFGVTKTNNGDVFSENFPKTAAIADKVTVIRSMVGRIPDHQQATYHLFTGYTPTAVIDFPQMGSVVSHELGVRGELPPYIAIPNNNSYAGSTGFLSSTFGPFELNADPGQPIRTSM